MKRNWWWIAPLALVGMALFVFLGGEVVMRLWNWLTPSLFGWRTITFWQALGLLALCRVLFGGFGVHGGPGRRMRARRDCMTPEERDRMRLRMRSRFGFAEAPHASD